MAREYLKKATLTSSSGASEVHDTVKGILDDIEAGGDAQRASNMRPSSTLRGHVFDYSEEIEAALCLGA